MSVTKLMYKPVLSDRTIYSVTNLLPISRGKTLKHGFELEDVPGDGYCGSHAISLSVGTAVIGQDWLDTDETLWLASKVAKYTVLYREQDNVLFLSKSESSEGKTAYIYQTPNHYLVMHKMPVLKDVTLIVNWKLTYVEYKTVLPNLSMDSLTFRYMTSNCPLTEQAVYESKIYPIPVFGFNEEAVTSYMSLNNDSEALLNKCKDDLNKAYTEGIHSITLGHGITTEYYFGRFKSEPSFGFGGYPNLESPFSLPPYLRTTVDLTVVEKLCGTKKIPLKELALNTLVKKSLTEDYSLTTSSWPTAQTAVLDPKSIETLLTILWHKTKPELLMSIKDIFMQIGHHNLKPLFEIDSGTLIKKMEEFDNIKPNPLREATIALYIRGVIFENLIRYHKSMIGTEMKVSDFILKMNNERPDLSRKLWLKGLSDAGNMVELGQQLQKYFVGHEYKVMSKLVFDRTPDCMNVVENGEWLTLVVCDPSTAGSVDARKADKVNKYGLLKKLLNRTKLVDMRMETPILNSSGTNVQSCIGEILKCKSPNAELCKVTEMLCRNLTIFFNGLRDKHPSVMHEYSSNYRPIEIGELSEVIDNLPDYLTDRDYKLSGYSKDDLTRLMNFRPLESETKCQDDKVFNSISDTIRSTMGKQTKGQHTLATREDIYLSKDKKIKDIRKSFADICEPGLCGKHDLIGYMPAPTCYKPTESGLYKCVDMLRNYSGTDTVFTTISSGFRALDEKMIELTKGPKNEIYQSDRQVYETELNHYKDSSKQVMVTGKNKIKLNGYNATQWVNEVAASKGRKGSKHPPKGYNKQSVDRIENLLIKMEELSSGTPDKILNTLMEAEDQFTLTPHERRRLTKYLSSKGSHMMASLSRMAHELSLCLTYDQKDREIIISNLGLENIVAVVAPGPGLSDTNYPRHVKFAYKDTLDEQGMRGVKSSDGWTVQEGFSKITHKSLVHLSNMTRCLIPYYNEISLVTDGPIDDQFKRSLHQIYWMVGDGNTNKMLGVIRYLSLMVFSVVCNPCKLIEDELGPNAIPRWKDIHIYTLHQVWKNVPKLVEYVYSYKPDGNHEFGNLVNSVEFKPPRLLHKGNHNSFCDMLNEFYMYYTWNKSQVSLFEGCKRITNKLIKIRGLCHPKAIEAMDDVDSDPTKLHLTELHLNTGYRAALFPKEEFNAYLAESLEYLGNGVKEDQPGVGSGIVMATSMTRWLKEVGAKDLLRSNFQPFKQGVEELSNTRGSLSRTDLVNKDLPIVSTTLKKLHDRVVAKVGGALPVKLGATSDGPIRKLETLEQSIRPSEQKRVYSKRLAKLGYDVRSKCILEVINLLSKHHDKLKQSVDDTLSVGKLCLDSVIKEFIVDRLDTIHGLSPKTQHLSDRELRVMDIHSKAGMKVVEDLARHLNRLDKRETSTTDKEKSLSQLRASKKAHTFTRTGKAICLKLSADKSKWGPGVLPTEIIPMLRRIALECPYLANTCRISMFMAIKLQSKRVMVPKELITHWWAHDIDLDKLNKTHPEVADFLRSFDMSKRSSFDNINDMGQGIMNAFTSLKHLMCTSLSRDIYYDLIPRNNLSYDFAQLSSDDSHEQQTFTIGKSTVNHIKTWLTVKTFCWRTHNMISNKKKTAGTTTITEYNSNFNLPPLSAPPNIKQIVAAGTMNFSYSWSETVRGKLSEIKSASEHGVTNSTCYLLQKLNKSYYYQLFGIHTILQYMKELMPADKYQQALTMHKTGAIEFMRFPIMDVVKLNMFGLMESTLDSTRNPVQMDILTRISNPVYYADNNDDLIQADKFDNGIGIKSMRFRLHKIEKLDDCRKATKSKLLEDYGELEESELLNKNPFLYLERPETLFQQRLQMNKTLSSANMQTAFSNFEGMRGIMRLYGLRYTANYGDKGSYTENFSFMSLMMLMFLDQVYELPTEESRYSRLKFNKNIFSSNQIKSEWVAFIMNLQDKKPRSLNMQLKTIKSICESSLDICDACKPDVNDIIESNPSQPTLMRKPNWNSEYMLRDNVVKTVKSMWADELNLQQPLEDINEYDISVLKELYKVGPLSSMAESWGVELNGTNISKLVSWLIRYSKLAYKPNRLCYGRATTSSGTHKMVNDLYCYNEDHEYIYNPPYYVTRAPRKWSYSDELYDLLTSFCVLMPTCTNHFQFRNICLATLKDINKSRVSIGLPELRITPEIIEDHSVSQDMRFVCVCLLEPRADQFSNSTTASLKKACSVKNYAYIQEQDIEVLDEEGVLTDVYKTDSDCEVEYFESGNSIRLKHVKGTKPTITLLNDVNKVPGSFINSCVKDFFTSKCSVSYIDENCQPNKHWVGLSKRPGNLIAYYSLDKCEILYNYRPNCIPVYHGNKVSLDRKVLDLSGVEFQLNWINKTIQITSTYKVLAYHKTVLRYYGTVYYRKLNQQTATTVLKHSLSYRGPGKLENMLLAVSVFDRLADTRETNDYYGAGLAYGSLVKGDHDMVEIAIGSTLIDLTTQLKYKEVLPIMQSSGMDISEVISDCNPSLTETVEQLEFGDVITKSLNDYKHIRQWIMPVTKDFDLFLNSMSVGLVEHQAIDVDLSDLEESPYNQSFENDDVQVIILENDNSMQVNDLIKTVMKSHQLRWLGNYDLFSKPVDNMEAAINKSYSQLALYAVTKSLDNLRKYIELGHGRHGGKLDYVESFKKFDRLSAIAIEMLREMKEPFPKQQPSMSLSYYTEYAIAIYESIRSVTGVDVNRLRSVEEDTGYHEAILLSLNVEDTYDYLFEMSYEDLLDKYGKKVKNKPKRKKVKGKGKGVRVKPTRNDW